MLTPASPEFVSLCRAQVAVLTQGLGAALSVVYLTEGMTGEQNELIPVVAHPEGMSSWSREQVLAFLARVGNGSEMQSRWQLQPGMLPDSSGRSRELPAAIARSPQENSPKASVEPGALDNPLSYPQPMMIPLVHEGVMMGLLVTARADRPWIPVEQSQIERIARTLSIACVLDHRAQWAEHDLHQQQNLQAYQNEVFDDLLHQFRNPLTALRTFGKLLMKRFRAAGPNQNDPNQSVAEGIVRESDRLQELLRRFEAVVDLGDANLLPDAGESHADLKSNDQPDALHPPSAIGMRALPSATTFLTGSQFTSETHPYYELVAPLLESAMAIAQDRQLTLHVQIPPNLPPIVTDPKALQEVWSNLIDNALKYTPSGGQIFLIGGIQKAFEDRMLQGLAIVDDGPGIPSTDLPQLFQRHYRGVQAQGQIPGTGLGLAIARDLVEQMNGEIQVFSPASHSGLLEVSAEHPGTAFIVWLPEDDSYQFNMKLQL